MPLIISNKKILPPDFYQAIIDLEVLSEAKAFLFICDGSITNELVAKIRSLRKELLPAKRIIAIVDSGGGSIDAAHRLLQFLRENGRALDIYVPEYAKSAATFLCLGADNIIMHENAELGPLDPQFKDPKGRRFISVLDRAKSIDYLRNHAIETFDIMTQLILKRTEFILKDAIEVAQNFTKNICEPLYSKVDPDKLGEYMRLIGIGEEYTRRAMIRYGYSSIGAKEVDRIVNKIIYGYPSHGFVIDYQEALDLKLNVRLPSADEKDKLDKISDFMGKISCVGTLPVIAKQAKKESEKPNGKETLGKEPVLQKR